MPYQYWQPIPEGVYDFILEEVEWKTGKESRQKYVMAIFRWIGTDRTIAKPYSLSENARWAAQELGVEDAYSIFTLKGNRYRMRVKPEEYNGRVHDRIVGVLAKVIDE